MHESTSLYVCKGRKKNHISLEIRLFYVILFTSTMWIAASSTDQCWYRNQSLAGDSRKKNECLTGVYTCKALYWKESSRGLCHFLHAIPQPDEELYHDFLRKFSKSSAGRTAHRVEDTHQWKELKRVIHVSKSMRKPSKETYKPSHLYFLFSLLYHSGLQKKILRGEKEKLCPVAQLLN